MKRASLLLPFAVGCTLFVDSLAPSSPEHLLPVGFASGDIDGDGDIDLVAVSFTFNAAHLSVLRQRGGELAAEIVTFPTSAFRVRPTLLSAMTSLVDVDGDQDLDLLTPTSTTELSVFTNDGSGSFSDEDIVFISDAEKIFVQDINGDLQPDLLSISPGEIQVRLNEGGVFGVATSVFTGAISAGLLGDFNSDGAVDLMVVNESARVSLLLNDGVGGFDESSLLIDSFFGFAPPSIGFDPFAVGDFDGDQRLDLAAAIADTTSAKMALFSQGSGGLSSPLLSEFGGRFTRRVLAGDLDGDLALDLVIAPEAHLRRLMNRGDGTFQEITSLDGSQVFPLEMVDIDGDGDLDVFCAVLGEDPTNMALFFNNEGDLSVRQSLTAGDVIAR